MARSSVGPRDAGRRESKRNASRLVRAASLVAVLVGGAVSLGACGGTDAPGVASVGSTTTTRPSPAAESASSDALRYSKCIRAHGVSNFPDPAPSGGFHVPGSVKGEPQFQSAAQACQPDAPGGGASAKHVNVHEELRYAECMRSHGIADFPDPLPGGGFRITNTDIRTTSPRFEAATSACAAKPGSPGVHPTGP